MSQDIAQSDSEKQHDAELSAAKRALLNKYRKGTVVRRTQTQDVIPAHDPNQAIPLSFGQQQLWLLDQLLPGVPTYTECATVYLPGLLNVSALQQALNELVKRHEAWRTNFVVEDNEPVQKVNPPFPVPFSYQDMRHLPEAQREPEAVRLAAQNAQEPFDLAHGPLLRALLFQLDEQEHRLFIILHHIIFDGVSLYQIFLPELYTLYTTFDNGETASPLAPLPLQYADFAAWQRHTFSQQEIERQLSYWKTQLQDAPTQLNLPFDHPRPHNPTNRGAAYNFTFSRELTEGLKSLSQREGVSLYTVLVAAFQTMLYRYTNQSDMLTGFVSDGRTHTALRPLLGYFLNTLVLRAKVSDTLTFGELLHQTRDTMLEAIAHQDVPFEYLVKELHPERIPGQNPLIQTSVSLVPPPPTYESGWTVTQMDVSTRSAKFDVAIELDDRPEGLTGRYEYSTDLFDAPTIERMVHHWQHILESVVQDTTQPLALIPLLTESEQHSMLVEWNDTHHPFPDTVCIHQQFEEQVERTPDAIAVTFESTSLTYHDLNHRANRIAHHLQELGVVPDSIVGVCMERSLEMVIALLAILKAGGAYVPLEPTYPQERLNYLMQDAQLPIILTQTRFRELLPHDETHVLCLDDEQVMATLQNEENPTSEVMPDNLIYVLYTSGSTGRPKGVMLMHRAIVNRLHDMQRRYQLTAEDRMMQKTPFGFDVSVWEFFWPLLYGSRLVVARPGGHQDAAYLANFIREQRITTMHFVPSMLRAVLMEPHIERCTSIKRVFCGGEVLTNELQTQFFNHFAHTDAHLYNFYGPTETAIEATAWQCQRDSNDTVVPIGYPIDNIQTYILNASLQPVPIGVAGELHIGGVGLARGYFKRPELTAEKFIVNPFDTNVGVRFIAPSRLFKSGDVARYRADGAIEFLGRIDHQVKIRGVRIELGEVEAALLQHPDVQEGIVVAREDTPNNKRLVAYIVMKEQQSSGVDDLRGFLKERLTQDMLPSAFVFLDQLPLLSNGKVDHHALPAPDWTRPELEETFVAPRTELEEQLVAVWAQVLGIDQVGIRDNFFDLGGHSLLAARLVTRIKQVCGLTLTLSMLFANPTIEQLAHALQQEGTPRTQTPIIPVQHDPKSTKRPFFFLHGDPSGGAFYCFPMARMLGTDQPFYVLEPYRMTDMLNPPTLEQIATAHVEALRTVQPTGPYLIGGWCLGAVIAYEVVRRLQAQGEQVDLLVLMDPGSASRMGKVFHDILAATARVVPMHRNQQLALFLRIQGLYNSVRLIQYHRARRRAFAHTNEQTKKSKTPWQVITSAVNGFVSLIRLDDMETQHYRNVLNWLLADYDIGVYDGPITFLWAEGEPVQGLWQQKIQRGTNITFQHIPGTHMTCRTQHLPALAEQLHLSLEKAHNSTGR